MPQSTGLGIPMIHKPVPITTPKAVFSASWMRKSRLRRVVASSRAAVVFCRSREPAETIAQILPLQKYEDYEYCGDAGCCERPQQGRNQGGDALQGSWRRLPDLDRYRSRLLCRRRN